MKNRHEAPKPMFKVAALAVLFGLPAIYCAYKCWLLLMIPLALFCAFWVAGKILDWLIG